MNRNISVPLTAVGINRLIRQLKDYDKWLKAKAALLAERLAEYGYREVQVTLSGHIFSGETMGSLTVERTDDTHFVISIASEAALFLEFGSGLVGFGHPEAGQNGMGPGTYPGKGHWADPGGWWFRTDDPRLIVKTDKDGNGWGHSRGMPPAMPVYGAMRSVEQEIETIIQGVFTS